MLNEFRSTYITWDKATSRIYSPVTANASDENGRKLVVQIVNSGQVEDLTGATLHLYWETRDKAHDGLDVFDAVDLKKGEFELSYTTGMLSNQGVLNANLVLIDTVGRVVSERFKITVTEGIDNDAIQSENSFSSLTQALIDISNLEQNYAPRLNDLTAQLQQTEQELTAQLAQTIKQGEVTVSDINKNKGKLDQTYLSEELLQQIAGNAPINAVVANESITTSKLAQKAVTGDKTDFLIQNPNIFNKDDVIKGGYYDDWGGWKVNVDRVSTPFMKIVGGATYPTNSTYFGYLTFYDANKTRVAGYGVGAWSSPIVVPANAVYMTIMYTTSYDLSTLMICKDTLPGTYVPYGFVLSDKLELSSEMKIETQAKINASWTNNLTLGPITNNLFDKTKVVEGYEVYSNGNIQLQGSGSAVTDYIPVSGQTSIYVSGLTAYSEGLNRYSFFYDANKSPIGSLVTIPKENVEQQITVPKNAVYFVMSIYQRKTSSETINLDTIQIEYGAFKSPYSPYTLGVTKILNYGVNGGDDNSVSTLKTSGKNLLAFGDSITETATVSDDGATYTEGTRSNWATYSRSALKIGQMYNYAKSGAHFVDGYQPGQIRQQLYTQISTAISNNRPADIIVVSIGTNDDTGALVLGDYDTAMSKATLNDLDRTKLAEAVRWAFWQLRTSYPNTVCFYATPIQRADKELNQTMIDLIVKIAKRYNFIIIDAQNESGIVRDFEVNGGAGRYLSDGLHPNSAGQQIMSKLYNRVILNTLNDAS